MACFKTATVLTISINVMGPVTFSLTCDISVETPRKTVEVVEGESETLECEYFADQSCMNQYLEWCITAAGSTCETIIQITDSQVYWFEDNEDYYSYDGNNLIIDEAQTEHEGEYWCTVVGSGIRETDTLNVFVLVPFAPMDIFISIDESPVFEGNDVLLTCTANGLPTPVYEWTQNGVELLDRNKYQINKDGGELTILSITKHEREYYNCTATNEKGSDATAAFIDVYYEPQTAWPLCEVHVETDENFMAEGDFAELTCKATGGNPPPHLEWYNNSQALPECTSTTDDDDVVTETVSCWTLTLYDNGKLYECKGNHAATEETLNCFTEVFDVKFPPSEPEGCITSLTGYSSPVVEGDDLVLTCTSCSGNPTPIIEWFEDENKIEAGLGDIYNSPGVYHGEISVQDLTLHLTYHNHWQRLRCESFNEEFTMEKDRAVSDEIILNVHYAPFVMNEENNKRLVVILTEEGDLLCEINSNPDVEITWFDNNNETICNGTGKFLVRKTTADAITTGVLTIFNASDSDLGGYRCHAINYIDEVNFTIHLSAKSSPDPATELEVIDRREANLTVQWTAGNDGGSEQVFHLEYIQQNMAAMYVVPDYCDPLGKTTNVTTKTYDTITDLNPMTSYSIVVVSSNEIGCTRSHPVVDSTLPRTPVEDEDIKFNQYTGELLIIAPVGSCIKIDKRKSDDVWITLTFHTANGSCVGSVTYTVEGSALLRIYFCNDDYTDCGEPYETEFHVKGKSNTSAIIGISLTTVVLLATLCVGIYVYVRRRNYKDTEDNVGPVYETPKTVAFDDYMDIVTPKNKPGTGVDNDGAYAELRQTKTEYMGLVFTNRNQGVLESNDDMETTNEPLQLYAECDLKSPPASSDLVFGDTIIDGVFTKLIKARLTVSSRRALTVSVKMLKDPNDVEGKQALWREAEFMRSLTDNENIVSCLKELTTEVPLHFVLEYCHHGNLKSYLRKLDYKATEMRELLLFSLDSAKGMCFLAEMQCVHRQLSARVVMVDGQKTCKISELGFSTAVMDKETYERMNKGTLPIRWMALESIDECLYTSATDVWSYGILLWEIFSFGINPYRGMNLKDVVSNVQQGYRLPMPNKCPENVYSIMQRCWQEDSSGRPTFHDLVELLEPLSDTSTAGIQGMT